MIAPHEFIHEAFFYLVIRWKRPLILKSLPVFKALVSIFVEKAKELLSPTPTSYQLFADTESTVLLIISKL